MNGARLRGIYQWLPAVIGLVTAAAVTVVAGSQTTRFGDAADYMSAAQAIIDGQQYPRESSLPFFRPPLYSFLIALVWLPAPGSVLAIKIVQAILFAATCQLLYQVGTILYDKDHRPALIGALLYSVNPFALRQVAEIQTECLHTFLIALGVFFLARTLSRETPVRRYALLAGITFGSASLCRPTALPIGLALAVGVMAIGFRGKQPSSHFKAAAVMIAGVLLTLAPWAFSNYKATGEFILTTDGGGYHLWLGNHPAELRLYEGDFQNQQQFNDYSYKYLQVDLPREKMIEWENTGGYKSLSLKTREARWQQAALQNMKNYPRETARLLAHKTAAFWRPWLLPGAYPRPLVIASSTFLLPLYLLALSGFVVTYRSARARPSLFLLVLLFVVCTGVHTISHVMMRFRLPYVDPYLSVLAGMAVWHSVARKLPRRVGSPESETANPRTVTDRSAPPPAAASGASPKDFGKKNNSLLI